MLPGRIAPPEARRSANRRRRISGPNGVSGWSSSASSNSVRRRSTAIDAWIVRSRSIGSATWVRELRVHGDDAIAEQAVLGAPVAARRVDRERLLGEGADRQQVLAHRRARKGEEQVVDRRPQRVGDVVQFVERERHAGVARAASTWGRRAHTLGSAGAATAGSCNANTAARRCSRRSPSVAFWTAELGERRAQPVVTVGELLLGDAVRSARRRDLPQGRR